MNHIMPEIIDPTRFEWNKPESDTEIFEFKGEDGRTITKLTISTKEEADEWDILSDLDMALSTSSIGESSFNMYDKSERGPHKTELIVYAKALIRGHIYKVEFTREATWEYGNEVHLITKKE